MKKVTVFFDFEGWWETPYKGSFDLNSIITNILYILKKHGIKAVFNTCGVIGEHSPDLIKSIFEGGHELASHGFKHENFSQLNEKELHSILIKTEDIFKKLTGKKPIGIRSPWAVTTPTVYSVFKKRGYKWASNQYTTFPEIFEKPYQQKQLMYTLAKYFLKFQHKFLYPRAPYKNGGILEIPFLSSMDADLLSIVSVTQNTPPNLLAYSYNVYKRQFSNSKEYFNLNFHPWLIGSGNRLKLLDNTLNYISKQRKVKFVLAEEIMETINKNG